MAHIGVMNKTKQQQTLQWNGKAIVFEPGQTRIVEGIPHDYIQGRVHIQHKTKKKLVEGEEVVVQLPHLQQEHLFEIVPLADALKHAAPEEDPKVVAARVAANAKAEERKQLLAELRQELESEGWQPPVKDEKVVEEPKKGRKGGKEAAMAV